ncbi:arylsulfatase [Maribellus maritimus]|uniref:arylsulfatase n=1 Tax=Maribellus maritimus TaxID=2870838 RepID=UPI001EEB523C|nr:arylsulfatase [Maribellus maritimus]MCG6186320.1 arylsulfatase [Maribellus maritimus]
MNRLKYSILVISVLFVSCSKKQPNVILIMTDDQGYGDLACHGNPYVKTPALDKLYQESARFTDFHVDPCCSPTRAALMTGCYSSRAGVWNTIGGRSLLKEGMTTIADVFDNNGYATGIFGKWHLGENYPFRPNDRGFRESIVHGGGAIGANPDYWGNDYDDDTYIHNGNYEKFEGYCNTVWFSEAIKYIKNNRNKPFFCYISTNVPHAPLRVDEEYVKPYKNLVSDRLAHYYGMVTKLDEDLGNLLTTLKEWDLEKNTILIFMTDNGPCPWFGGIVIDFETGFVKEGYSAGMRGGKIWGYENAHRVPFFIRWPGAKIGGGKEINALSAHIDLMPTLIDLCDLKKPENLKHDGRSLVPLLNEEVKEWPERTLFIHNQRVEYPVKDKEYQVLTEKWRLVKREKDELYDIKSDPRERNDVAAQNPDIVKDLYGRYEKWWEDISVDFDTYAEIAIGTEHENPVTLNAHDAHTRDGKKIWVVNVARDGKYEIKLNHWPAESGKRIVENTSGDIDLPIASADLTVGNMNRTAKVTAEMKSANFKVDLKAGTTCLQAYFNLKEPGKTIRTDCVYVEYLGDPDPTELAKYNASVPFDVLKENYRQNVVLYD